MLRGGETFFWYELPAEIHDSWLCSNGLTLIIACLLPFTWLAGRYLVR